MSSVLFLILVHSEIAYDIANPSARICADG